MAYNEISPMLWGPHMWKLLYTLADHLTSESELITFIVGNLGTILPCPECQIHFKQYYIAHPIDNNWRELHDEQLRYAVMKWLWELQNYIRTVKKQPIIVPTVEIAINLYKDYVIPVDELNYIYMSINSATNMGIVQPVYKDDWWTAIRTLCSLLTPTRTIYEYLSKLGN